MQVIFLRHGTRNYGIGDVPLNPDGISEAAALAEDPCLSKVTHIFCSPKKRAQMTVTPLAKKIGVPISTSEGLDQQSSEETNGEFTARVQTAIEKMTEKITASDIVLVCSHSDWLTLAAQVVPSDDIDPRSVFYHCANYRTYRIEDQLWLPQ